MAPNASITTIVILFFILETVRGEAHNAGPPVTNKANPNFPSDCARKHIKSHMEETAAKCKDFEKKEIMRRLQDPSLIGKDLRCLISCYGGYQAAIVSMDKGISDVSTGLYAAAVEDVVTFTLAIAPCMKCSVKLTLNDPEFWEFQKWATNSAEDLRNKLKSCTKQ